MTVLATAKVVLTTDLGQFLPGLVEAEEAMESAGRRMTEVGRELSMKLTLPLLGVGAAAVKAGADFDETLRRIPALTETTAAEIAEWRGQVRELAVEFGSTGKDAAEALYAITSSGIKGQAAMETLKAALTATAIGLGETKVVADAATSAMNAYVSTGMTATRATEILAAGIKYGKFEAASLAPVIGSLTGTASALGITFEDIIGTLAVFSLTGTDAAEGATQLSAIMSTLLGTTKEGEDALRAQGLSLEELRQVAAGPRGLVSVMRILEQAFEGQLDKLALVIPNIRAFRGVMNALAQDASIVNNVLDGTVNSTGILTKALAESAGPSHEFRVAWAGIKDALIEVGDVLLPTVTPLVKNIGAAVRAAAKSFGELSPQVQQTIVVTLALAAALGPVILALGTLMKMFVLFKMSTILSGFQKLGMLLGVGGAVLVGLTLVTAAWAQMKMEVIRVEGHIKDANQAMRETFLASDPATAAAKVTRFNEVIARLQQRADDARAKLVPLKAILDALPANTTVGGSIAHFKARDTKKDAAALQTTIEELDATILRMTERRADLEAVAKAYAELQATPPATSVVPPRTDPALVAAQEAFEAYTDQLLKVARTEELLGDQFDENAAKIRANTEVVQALVDTGIDMDAVVGKNGETLRQLATRLKEAELAVKSAKDAEEELQDVLSLAEAAVQASLTPLQEYERTMSALNRALSLGKITQDQFAQATKRAKDELDNATNKASEFEQGVKGVAMNATDAFVDMAFGAKMSFGDFVKSALMDLAKLILRIQMMKLLFPTGGGGLGGLMGFARGGFLQAGQVGLVGELGPELISGGRGGLRVTPMPAVRSAGRDDGGGGTTVVNVNVNAIDQRGVAEFFESNEGLVASAIIRAQRKSSSVRRQLGGG